MGPGWECRGFKSDTAVDVWDYHWCNTPTMRVDAFVPRIDQALAAARSLGMTVMLCPSYVVDNYVGFHTQVCLLGKPMGLRAMKRAGLRCMLARDMTDAHPGYDPAREFTPDRITEQVVKYHGVMFSVCGDRFHSSLCQECVVGRLRQLLLDAADQFPYAVRMVQAEPSDYDAEGGGRATMGQVGG